MDTLHSQAILLNQGTRRNPATQFSREPTASHSRHTLRTEPQLSDNHSKVWRDTASSPTGNLCKILTPDNR